MKIFLPALFLLLVSSTIQASNTQQRIDDDLANGRPIVIHASVALADNKNQWIARVPESIGNGQDARTNLYWGARYGVKTFLVKDAGWKIVERISPQNQQILQRLVFFKRMMRGGKPVSVYLVADAWDGRYIEETTRQFLSFNAGSNAIHLSIKGHPELPAGGAAHLKVYIGHNVLMDYLGMKDRLIVTPSPLSDALHSDAVVLACKSQPYFEPRLKTLGAHSLVLTTGLMAPEAYSLDAAITAWVSGHEDNDVRKAAATAYSQYQKINLKPAQRLFGVKP